jgi:4-hydroxy-3-polyprenylbenzoate decarboxylase
MTAHRGSGQSVETKATADLRDWLDGMRTLGKLREVHGASWDLEVGVLTDLNAKARKWTLLFDDIPGYPAGHRIVTGCLLDAARVAVTLGLPAGLSDQGLVKELRGRLRTWREVSRMHPPVVEGAAPFTENRMTGAEVDLLRFPAPRWHEHDGGRYLGSSDAVITRDPESGWVNLGTYRLMVHDARHVGAFINVSHHGRMHAEKYWARGEGCPVAVSLGHHPLISALAGLEVPTGVSEYDYAGGLLSRPYRVVPGPLTGLPLPADSEIVLEGELVPELRDEGPYGEYMGYYAGGVMKNPVIRVDAIHFRDNPILMGTSAGRPPYDYSYFRCPVRAAMLWNALETAGVPGIQGVWCHEAGYSRAFNIISIKQAYRGHAIQAGMLASQAREGIFGGKYVVVVDDDIDPSNTNDVLWAISSRTDPVEAIEFVRNSWGMNLDPMAPHGSHPADIGMSRAIINACKPYGRALRGDFPRVVESSPGVTDSIVRKWREVLE